MKRVLINIVMLICLCIMQSCSNNDSKIQNFKISYFNILKVEHYPTGEVKIECYKNNNQLDSLYKEYYKNGQLACIGYYKMGIEIDSFKFYYSNGVIKEKQYYSKQGLLTDIKLYDSTGNRKPYKGVVFEQIEPLIINVEHIQKKNESIKNRTIFLCDTIKLGQTYKARVRLMNQKYDDTQIHIIPLKEATELGIRVYDDNIGRLINLNSRTAIYQIKPSKKGIYRIEGVVFDIQNKKDKDGNTTMSPNIFEYSIFVK